MYRLLLFIFIALIAIGVGRGAFSSGAPAPALDVHMHERGQTFFNEAFKWPIFEDLPSQPVTGQSVLLLFFEPNCSWCLKQSQVINLLAACEKQFSIAGIGVNGSRWALKKMGWQLKAKYPLYQATKSFLRLIPPIKATPTLFWVDPQGNISGQQIGFIPFSRLVNQLSALTFLKCTELSD